MELKEVLSRVTTDTFKFESELNEKISDYSDKRIQLQAKQDKLFDDKVSGRSVDSKEIDKLSAEIVSINGLIAALERQAQKGYEIPESNKQEIIQAAADEYLKNSLDTISQNIRLEEINKQLWDLMDEQKEINKIIYLMGSNDIDSEFKYYSSLDEDTAKDIISEAKERVDITNNPEYIRLNKKLNDTKSGYPYFWNRYI